MGLCASTDFQIMQQLGLVTMTQYSQREQQVKEYTFAIFDMRIFPTFPVNFRRNDMESSGEEYECAVYLERHKDVKAWVRNTSRQPHSFWLQTSTDRFYPDFVCELTDGRFLVIEYKGFDRWSDDDSTEKRSIGKVWEDKSDGTCLFLMPQGPDWNAIMAKLK